MVIKKNLPYYIPLIKTTVFEKEREIPPAKKSRPMIGLFLPLLPSLSTTPAYILGKRSICLGIYMIYHPAIKWKQGKFQVKKAPCILALYPTQRIPLPNQIPWFSPYPIIIVIISNIKRVCLDTVFLQKIKTILLKKL